ncbi:MAG: glycerophosphodiester phosphodiesterase family protein [Acidobacteriota bacterium]
MLPRCLRVSWALTVISFLGCAASMPSVHLGPRPFYLVDAMEESALKRELEECKGPFEAHPFSIGHRGAPLQFPEHTRESYVAAARMGAGILECDVTFTRDGELVCRHAQCDLHTTTDILTRPELASKCSEPFRPAKLGNDGTVLEPARARCCASDLTLREFKTLCGKMDASDPAAQTAEQFQGGTANWRTDLYSTCGEVLSHRESIELFQQLGTGMTPELKVADPGDVARVFGGPKTREVYAQKLIDDYRRAGIPASRVFAQSFQLDDVLYWIENEPEFGRQAVLLEDGPIPHPDPQRHLEALASEGVRIVAPSMPMLLTTGADGGIKPSEYAAAARGVGLDILSWTVERSGRLTEDVVQGGNTYYYQTVERALADDGAVFEMIDVLAQDVGIRGLFSDWPATTTFYANCKLP